MTGMPFLTAVDPVGAGEGTLDPLGLYQVSDQLAVSLVPAVRERMQRVRFLTAMAVGAYVTRDFRHDSDTGGGAHYLVWEWLVVEALIRAMGDHPGLRGVPGTLVARRAISSPGYIDARTYLKTPRIFGFHGVYKRLALHLKIVDVNLRPATNTEAVVDAWAKGQRLGGIQGAKDQLKRWRDAVTKSIENRPARTKTGWSGDQWQELADAMAPHRCMAKERRCLADLLLKPDGEQNLGALRDIWELQAGFGDGTYGEEVLHDHLEKQYPRHAPLLKAIRAYERFARQLQDAFDILRAEASKDDVNGTDVTVIARDPEFAETIRGLAGRVKASRTALAELSGLQGGLATSFDKRFTQFAEPIDAAQVARMLCEHHESVQRGKSVEGKRSWFDRLGGDRIRVRQAYREPRRELLPNRYVHGYRGWPIRRFYQDLQS